MMGIKKFNMKQYHTLSLDDLVSPNNLYRKIDEAIDFSFIYDLAKEAYSHTGQPSLDPIVFFKIELVGFLEGIHEDRALERRIKDSLAIRWFLGYDLDEPLPVHSTISRTRKDRISEALYQAVFDHILGVCISRQLVKGSHQSIDSTLLKANASLDSLEALQPKVLEHYKKASKDDEEDKTPPPSSPCISKPLRRDAEAKVAKKPGFPAAPCYKASISTDKGCGVITHAQVDDGNQNDVGLLSSIVSRSAERLKRFGLLLKSIASDLGFYSAENLSFLDQCDVTAYMAVEYQHNNKDCLDRSHFQYDAEKDQFTCPQGRPLRFYSYHHRCKHIKKYKASKRDCSVCPQKPGCTPNKARMIHRSIYDELIQQAIMRSETPEGKKMLSLRRTQSEGSYATIKERLKFRKYYCLGFENAKKKFLMACSVVNLKKLISIPEALLDTVCHIFAAFISCFKEQAMQKCYYALN